MIRLIMLLVQNKEIKGLPDTILFILLCGIAAGALIYFLMNKIASIIKNSKGAFNYGYAPFSLSSLLNFQEKGVFVLYKDEQIDSDKKICPNCFKIVSEDEKNCPCCTKALDQDTNNNEIEDKTFLKKYGFFARWERLNSLYLSSFEARISLYSNILFCIFLILCLEGYGIIPFAGIIAGGIIIKILFKIILRIRKNNFYKECKKWHQEMDRVRPVEK